MFKKAINENNIHISNALDTIPLEGKITKNNYDEFVLEFKKALPQFKNPIGTFSRLLAMKRPDYFVCVDSKNMILLCKEFGLKKSEISYETYWDDIILRIQDSIWYNSSKPHKGSKNIKIHEFRSAFLDCLYYNH